MFEMLAELLSILAEKRRDPDMALVHLERAAKLDGPSQLSIGNVIRQELASHAILVDDDGQSTALDSHLVRCAVEAGRQNLFVIGATVLAGPIVRAAHANIAAKLAGWASVSPFFAKYWLLQIRHIAARAGAALPAERFDRAFTAGKQASLTEVSGLMLGRLATLEALATH
jgi:hypothetical protein